MGDERASHPLPGGLKLARVLMYVQGGLSVLFVVLAILQRAGESSEAVEGAEQEAAGGRFLFALLFVAASVALLVYATKLPQLKTSTRTGIFVAEGFMVFAGVVGFFSNPAVGQLVNPALGLVVIGALLSREARAAFVGASHGSGYRLDPRSVPDLDTPREE